MRARATRRSRSSIEASLLARERKALGEFVVAQPNPPHVVRRTLIDVRSRRIKAALSAGEYLGDKGSMHEALQGFVLDALWMLHGRRKWKWMLRKWPKMMEEWLRMFEEERAQIDAEVRLSADS